MNTGHGPVPAPSRTRPDYRSDTGQPHRQGRRPVPACGARRRRCSRPTVVDVRTPDRHVVDGRTVLTRAEICRVFDIGQSTAERWWREREDNAHPPVAHREGRRQWWDEQAMAEFIEAAREPEQLEYEGRILCTRQALAKQADVSESHLKKLYGDRTKNGHPEVALSRGRRYYFDRETFHAWWKTLQAEQLATLTAVDRGGDPDELVGLTEAARVLGYRDPGTLRAYLARNPGYFPESDATDDRGHRLYQRRTLWEFADSRTRPGRAGRRSAGQ